MLAMPEAEKYLKLNKKPHITGNPVRQELLKMTREEALALAKITVKKAVSVKTEI